MSLLSAEIGYSVNVTDVLVTMFHNVTCCNEARQYGLRQTIDDECSEDSNVECCLQVTIDMANQQTNRISFVERRQQCGYAQVSYYRQPAYSNYTHKMQPKKSGFV